jgi:hypothetical protein
VKVNVGREGGREDKDGWYIFKEKETGGKRAMTFARKKEGTILLQEARNNVVLKCIHI